MTTRVDEFCIVQFNKQKGIYKNAFYVYQDLRLSCVLTDKRLVGAVLGLDPGNEFLEGELRGQLGTGAGRGGRSGGSSSRGRNGGFRLNGGGGRSDRGLDGSRGSNGSLSGDGSGSSRGGSSSSSRSDSRLGGRSNRRLGRGRRRRTARSRTRAHRGRQVAALNVHAAEEPVLGARGVVAARQAQHAQVPVGAVGAGAGVEGTGRLLQRVGARGVVERHGSGVEVDLVCHVVPLVRHELDVPLADAADVPLQVSAAAAVRAVLEFREVGLKEGDLVLVVGGGLVGARRLDGEVVVQFSLVDGGGGLGDQLGAQHALAVPLCGLVDGDLDALLGGCVGGVLEGAVQVHVFGDGAWAVDVVLVAAYGVGEGPLLEVRVGGVVVEAAIPDGGAWLLC